MDPKYLTGIAEIDAQHTEIEEVAQAVIEAAAAKDTWHIVHYILVRLYELLRFHFAVEESVMAIVSFPEIQAHKQVHKDILLTVERMKVASLDPSLRERRGAEQAVQFPDAHRRPRQALRRIRPRQLLRPPPLKSGRPLRACDS